MLNIKVFMSAFDSSLFQSKITEITELYNQLDVSRKDAYNSLTIEEKTTIINSLDILMRKMIEVYNDLSAYDNSEANSMKELIRTYADNMDFLKFLEKNQILRVGIDTLVNDLRIKI